MGTSIKLRAYGLCHDRIDDERPLAGYRVEAGRKQGARDDSEQRGRTRGHHDLFRRYVVAICEALAQFGGVVVGIEIAFP